MTLEEIKTKINAGEKPEPLIEELTSLIDANPRDDEALTTRGQLRWKLNDRSGAINDWLAAIRINPQSRAKVLMETTRSILNFYNKDLYNP